MTGISSVEAIDSPRTTGSTQCATDLEGVAASRGVHTGRARLITSPESFGRVTPGDVIVCSHVPPSWAILFRTAGAIVAEGGGVLSNGAILAREHRLPAVVGTGTAISLIKEGQRVTVDGDRGLVRITT